MDNPLTRNESSRARRWKLVGRIGNGQSRSGDLTVGGQVATSAVTRDQSRKVSQALRRRRGPEGAEQRSIEKKQRFTQSVRRPPRPFVSRALHARRCRPLSRERRPPVRPRWATRRKVSRRVSEWWQEDPTEGNVCATRRRCRLNIADGPGYVPTDQRATGTPLQCFSPAPSRHLSLRHRGRRSRRRSRQETEPPESR